MSLLGILFWSASDGFDSLLGMIESCITVLHTGALLYILYGCSLDSFWFANVPPIFRDASVKVPSFIDI